MTKSILVIGGGGREHALAWKASQAPEVEVVYVAPGNAGTAVEPKLQNIGIAAENISALLAFARERAVDLTIVGPEAPLVDGIADRFNEAGLRVFGPSAAAAQLEGSKTFTKDFLQRHAIPTARYQSFTDLDAVNTYIDAHGAPLVIKADGLAAGKGVVVATTVAEAKAAAAEMLSNGAFGAAGHRVVVEDFLEGEEASFIAIVGGGRVLPLASSQDHKAAYDGDSGPNTGGMGAYSPAPVVDADVHARIMREIIEPTVAGLASEGIDYTGFLYAGLMISPDGAISVIEYNCRCGDPETQPIMMRFTGDLVSLCNAAIDGELPTQTQWHPQAALGVVLAAQGYPGSYPKGDAIEGLDQPTDDTKVFHAGTQLDGGRVVTAGGRVLCVCALGDSVSEAQAAAYQRASTIHWPGMQYRRDIGYRAIARET